MARVRLFKNFLEDTYEDIEIKAGKTICDVVREYGDDEEFSSCTVECYDSETGKTIYLPIEDEADFGIAVSVNGEEKSVDYVIQESDNCVVVITPMSNGVQSKDDSWNWVGAAVGLGVGFLLGGVVGALAWSAGLGSWGAAYAVTIAFASVGSVIGFIAGGIVGADIHKKKNNKGDNGDGNNLPDIAGSANQPITNNTIPLVLGKKEISPFILGSPVVRYTGKGGKDPYVSVLYGIGYSPLKITDIKFDCLPVTYNTKGDGGKVVYAGVLKGKGNEVINETTKEMGDIEVRWNSNDIKFELIQQNLNQNSIYYGDIYNKAIKQTQANVTPMFIKDSLITDLEQESKDVGNLVQYYNVMYDDGFRTNSIRFSEQYPSKVSVVLDMPEGLYLEYSDSNASSGTTRNNMPVWLAIQWRPYSESANKAENSSPDKIKPRSNPNNKYEFIKSTLQDGWITFDQIIVDSEKTDTGITVTKKIDPENYSSAKRVLDIRSHIANNLTKKKTGNYSSDEITAEFVKYATHTSSKGVDIPESFMYAQVVYTTESPAEGVVFKTGVDHVTFQNGFNSYDFITFPSGEYGTWSIGSVWWDLCPIEKDVFYKLPVDDNGNRYVRTTNWPKKSTWSYFANEGWEGAKLFNLQEAQKYLKDGDNENKSEFRVTATADIKAFCTNNGLSPSEFLFSDDNTTKCVEVRVVRISPNYLNMTSKQSKTEGPITYHDNIKWTVLETETINPGKTETELNAMTANKPISDRKYRDMCILAMSCKADTVGNIQNQIEKLSVTAQAFAPSWNSSEMCWYPKGVATKYKYYNASGSEITKSQYETLRQAGNTKAERVKGGNNWRELMDEIIFGSKTATATSGNISFNTKGTSKSTSIMKYLEDEKTKPTAQGGGNYLNNSPASQFVLACYGRHLGIDAMGEDRIHTLALGEWHDETIDVTDGAKDKDGELEHMFMTCNAYLYSGQKLEDLLSKIAVSGRAGYTLDDNGKLVAVMDNKVSSPSGVFNNQNAMATSIVYDFKPAPSGLNVTFNNEDNYGIAESVLVMIDDTEDYANPKREIEQVTLDFVTTLKQAFSMGRYILANKVFGKRALSWKCGIEGASIQYGYVMKVTHDLLMVGQSCGRIVDFIEDSQYIYGVILSDMYEFDGASNHAIEIMQPEQYSESKVIVVDVNSGAGLSYKTTEDGHKTGDPIPCQCVGMTNTVIFSQAMSKDGTFTSDSKTYYFSPKVGNLVNYGIKDKVSDLYRVKSKQPDEKFTYVFQLTPYQENFYNYGAAIPELNRNITVPSRVSDAEISVDTKITLSDLNQRADQVQKDVTEYVDEAIESVSGNEPPDKPVFDKNTYFCEDGIVLAPRQSAGGIKNIVDKYEFEICRNYSATEENTWVSVETVDGKYYFNRSVDGYPEYQDMAVGTETKLGLNHWRVRCKAVNGYNNKSDYSAPYAPNGDKYGTWILPNDVLKNENIERRVSGRNVTIQCAIKYSGIKEIYGDIRFKVSIKKGTESSAEDKWYKPNLISDPYGSESNYKTEGTPDYVVVSETFQQILPLTGQDLNDPMPVDTNYGYNIIAFNDVTECQIDTPIWLFVSPTSVKDIAANQITGNKIKNGTVTYENLHSDVLSANKMATYKMTAANAIIGKLSGNDISSKNNYWDLESGEFRVGGRDSNYIKFGKDSEGKDLFEIVADFSKIHSTLAVWPTGADFTQEPAFKVEPHDQQPERGQVTVNSKLNAPYVSIFGHSSNSEVAVAMSLGIDESLWGTGKTDIFIIAPNT